MNSTAYQHARPSSLARSGRLLLAAGITLIAACQRAPTPSADTRSDVAVQTITAQLTRHPETTEVVGTVRAKLAATVAAKVVAGIHEIPVRDGDAVTAGQLLAKLDDRELRAEFDRAKADFDRYQKLLANRAVTQAEFDAIQSRFRVAEAALSYTTVTAPFDGIIAEKLCNVGDLATPGKPLFTVEQPRAYRLEASVPERFSVILNQELPVFIEATGERCTGKVGEIVPAADPATRSTLIKIELQCQKSLRLGLFGRAQLPVGERAALLVPKGAVHQRGQLIYVFIADSGKAQMRLVRPGKTDRETVELLAGVQPGERVIVQGTVSDGQPVQP